MLLGRTEGSSRRRNSALDSDGSENHPRHRAVVFSIITMLSDCERHLPFGAFLVPFFSAPFFLHGTKTTSSQSL